MLDWDRWDIRHLWHVLRCTGHWKEIYLPDRLRRRAGVWNIGGIDRSTGQPPYGQLARDNQGYYLNHKNGKIRVEYKMKWKLYFRNLLRNYAGSLAVVVVHQLCERTTDDDSLVLDASGALGWMSCGGFGEGVHSVSAQVPFLMSVIVL